MLFLKEFFENVNLEKNDRQQKSNQNYRAGKVLIEMENEAVIDVVDKHSVIDFFYVDHNNSRCHEQLSLKFFWLINVKMPTTVGILTFISRINTTSESFKARKNLYIS